MKIIPSSYEILTPISEGGIEELKHIERVARTCYKSESLISEDGTSAKKLVTNLIKAGHEAMLEHSTLAVKFIVDRGVSHELVRHRIASFAQESTRYCNYSNDKFGNELTFIKPLFWDEDDDFYPTWVDSMQNAERNYNYLISIGAKPQEARSILPNSLKTEIVVTANYREWRTFFKLRTAQAAHPQMREVTIPLLKELQTQIPIIFDDIEVNEQ